MLVLSKDSTKISNKRISTATFCCTVTLTTDVKAVEKKYKIKMEKISITNIWPNENFRIDLKFVRVARSNVFLFLLYNSCQKNK